MLFRKELIFARNLLNELKYIPKKIQLLKEDIEATRKSLIKNPTY